MVRQVTDSTSADQGALRRGADSWRKSLFADLLRDIRLRSSVYFRAVFRAPWGVSIADHGTIFHIVVRGGCWLQVNGVADPVALRAGDLVVVTRGDTHVVSSAPTTPAVNYFDLIKRHPPTRMA